MTVADGQDVPKSAPPAAPKKARPPAPEARKPAAPMAEPEIQDLIELLQALKDQKPPATKERRTTKERLRVVLDDVTTLIVHIHAQETAKQFAGASGIGPEGRKWMDESFAKIQRCAEGRFEGRGTQAYRESIALVEKYRARLEPLVLELGRWRSERMGAAAPERQP